jgi:hypothetical protein
MSSRENDEFVPRKLSEEEKSQMWKTGIMFYILAGPFVWMTLGLFYTTNLKKDMFCTLANFGYDEAKILDTANMVETDQNHDFYSEDV